MKEILEEKIKQGKSIREISKELNKSYTCIKYNLDINNLKTNYIKKTILDKITNEKFINIVNMSDNLYSICYQIGYKSINAEIYKKIKDRCDKLNIIAPKYGSKNKNIEVGVSKNIEEIFIKESKSSRSTIKKKIIENGLIEYKCHECNNDGMWNNKKIVLHLDHINGKNNDNRLDNLRFLCPNCHSQTETYSGKNSRQNIKKCDCGKEIKQKSEKCNKCTSIERGLKNRKVERPDYKTLIKDIDELGYTGTGRKYGVSDNSVRKWIKKYNE